MNLLNETIGKITPGYSEPVKEAWKRIDSLTKPIGSLGTLEEIAAKMTGITGKLYNFINKKNIIIMCSDNGVIDEKVSTCPKSLTKTVTENFARGITGVCKLSDFAKSDITIVDIGIDGDVDNKKIIRRKVSYGTRNMVKGPAMTREEAVKAIEVGIEIVNELVEEGYNLFGTGEMGVANTTTSAAVLSVFSELSPDITAGKGSGLTDEQLAHKRDVIKRAIEINKPDKNDPIDVIAKVGGLDIAGLCGCFLGAAANRMPIVIDGFISSAAALCAYKLNPYVRDYIFPSHLSAEPGAVYVMKQLGLEPMLNLKMRLGEGSGCPLAFNIIEAALYTMNNMATLEEASIVNDFLIDIR